MELLIIWVALLTAFQTIWMYVLALLFMIALAVVAVMVIAALVILCHGLYCAALWLWRAFASWQSRPPSC
jgi:hypothetical protein